MRVKNSFQMPAGFFIPAEQAAHGKLPGLILLWFDSLFIAVTEDICSIASFVITLILRDPSYMVVCRLVCQLLNKTRHTVCKTTVLHRALLKLFSWQVRQLVKKQTEQTDLPLSHKQSVRHIISNGSCFHLTILIQTIFCRLLRIQKTNTFHSLLCPECIICIWTHRVHFTAFHQLLLLLLVQLTSSSEL